MTTVDMPRPMPWLGDPAPGGYEYVAVVADPEWSADPALLADRRCRQLVVGHKSCGRPAVLVLNRRRAHYDKVTGRVSTRPAWWGYCDDPEHTYGKWVEGGQVMTWVLRKIEQT